MKTQWLVCVSVWIVGAVVLAQVPQSSAPSTLVIGGRVIDAATQQPVAGAAVTLRGPAPLPDPPTLVADAEGRFRFDDLRPGRYTVVGAAVGYLAGSAGHNDEMPPTEVVVTLEAGASRTDARIGLVRPSSIVGSVLDSSNSPVEGAQMGALREVYVAGVRGFAIGSATASDDAGAFGFNGLAPGRYIVCVIGERLTLPGAMQSRIDNAATGTREDVMALSISARQSGMQAGANRGFAVGDFWIKPGNVSVGPLVDGEGMVWSAPDICNGGARNPRNAPVIALGLGEQRLGEILTVDLEPSPSVSGVVTGPTGPLPWQGVVLESEGFDALGWADGLPYASTSTDAAGRFTFLGVAAGNYTLKAYRIPQPHPGAAPGSLPEGDTLTVRMPISVGQSDVHDLGVVMASVAQPRVRFVFTGGAVPPTEAGRATALSFDNADGVTVRMPFLRPTLALHADGTVRTSGLWAGRYVVRVAPIGPWRLEKAELNGVDVSDTPFLVADEPQSEIVVTMTDVSWRLSGTVRDGRVLPVETGRVVVFPADRTRWVGYGAAPRRQRQADVRSGVYAIDGLPAGEYFVIALPPTFSGEWQRPERFAEWATTAQRITLGSRESRTLDLTLPLGGVR